MLALYGDSISQDTSAALTAGTRYRLSLDQSASQYMAGNSGEDSWLDLSIGDGTQAVTETYSEWVAMGK